MTFSPAQRILRARMGGLSTSAAGHVNTAPARAAFLARFEDQVDPERRLSPTERARRAEAARKAYMAGLALRSSVTRGKRKAVREVQHPRTASSEVGHDRPAPTP